MYEVKDNFLNEEVFTAIQRQIMSINIPWFFCPGVAGPEESDFCFTHMLYADNAPNSQLYGGIALPIIETVQPKAIRRIRIGLYIRGNTLLEHPMHTDCPFPHKVFMLYINTNNGYTTFEDETRVNCVANRAVFFDGSRPHRSSNCTDESRRIVLTMNYF
jgi:hypothetical protein